MARRNQVQLEFEDVIGDLIFFKELVVPLSIELGRAKITIDTFLDLEPGSIISRNSRNRSWGSRSSSANSWSRATSATSAMTTS